MVVGGGGGRRCCGWIDSLRRPSRWSIGIIMPYTITAILNRNSRRVHIRLGWIVCSMRYRNGRRPDANSICWDIPKTSLIRLGATHPKDKRTTQGKKKENSLSHISNLCNNRPRLCPPIFINCSFPLIKNVHDPIYKLLFLAGLCHMHAALLVESRYYLLQFLDRVVPDTVPDLLCE